MTNDPREHELLELGEMAAPNGDLPLGNGGSMEEPSQYAVDEVLRARQREELALLDRRIDPERPYLTRLPDTYAAEVTVFEWLDYLINAAGFKATGRALSYYVDLAWLTGDVKDGLRAYMRGFSEVESFDPDGPGPRELGLDDHALSLIYIARIAALSE